MNKASAKACNYCTILRMIYKPLKMCHLRNVGEAAFLFL